MPKETFPDIHGLPTQSLSRLKITYIFLQGCFFQGYLHMNILQGRRMGLTYTPIKNASVSSPFSRKSTKHPARASRSGFHSSRHTLGFNTCTLPVVSAISTTRVKDLALVPAIVADSIDLSYPHPIDTVCISTRILFLSYFIHTVDALRGTPFDETNFFHVYTTFFMFT